MKGRTEFGECYRAVRVPEDDPYLSRDGRGIYGDDYTTLEEAVADAVRIVRNGYLACIEHLPDGRTGHMGGFVGICDHLTLNAIIAATR